MLGSQHAAEHGTVKIYEPELMWGLV